MKVGSRVEDKICLLLYFWSGQHQQQDTAQGSDWCENDVIEFGDGGAAATCLASNAASALCSIRWARRSASAWHVRGIRQSNAKP